MTILWHLDDGVTATEVQYRAAGTTAWAGDQSNLHLSRTIGSKLHQATLHGLTTDTEYQFRTRLDDDPSSEIYDSRAAPLPGQGDFDAVFVADTGLIGRLDGLAVATAEIHDKIAALDPTLILGGGDYAYFDKDKRFGTLDATIDA